MLLPVGLRAYFLRAARNMLLKTRDGKDFIEPAVRTFLRESPDAVFHSTDLNGGARRGRFKNFRKVFFYAIYRNEIGGEGIGAGSGV